MYGLLVSTMIRSPGAAVAVGITTLFLVEFTKHLVGLDPYIFTRYITYPWLNLQQIAQGMDYQWRPEVWKMIGLCGVVVGHCFRHRADPVRPAGPQSLVRTQTAQPEPPGPGCAANRKDGPAGRPGSEIRCRRSPAKRTPASGRADLGRVGEHHAVFSGGP